MWRMVRTRAATKRSIGSKGRSVSQRAAGECQTPSTTQWTVISVTKAAAAHRKTGRLKRDANWVSETVPEDPK
jgi:hypothetical protein